MPRKSPSSSYPTFVAVRASFLPLSSNGVVYAARGSSAFSTRGGAPSISCRRSSVKARDKAGNKDPTPVERAFVVDTTAPTVVTREPGDGATNVGRNADVVTTFSEDMDRSSVEAPGTFALVGEDAATAITATASYDPATRRAKLDPSQDLDSSATYRATIRGGAKGVKDAAGNALASDDSWSFTTAGTVAPAPPTIDLPAASDTGVSNNDNLTNDDTPTLEGESEAGSTVKVYDGGALLGSTTASPDGAWAFRTPSLSNGSHNLSATANDAAGNTYGNVAGEVVYPQSSSTALLVTVDLVRPAVSAVSPAAGANTVAAAANTYATFSEAMDAGTVNASSFTLVLGGATVPISSVVSYNVTSRQAVLDPSAALVAGAGYTATVKAAVRDLAGNPLGSDKIWSFSINSAPTVTSMAPAPGTSTTDRTPIVAATVRDAQTNLAKTSMIFYRGRHAEDDVYLRRHGRPAEVRSGIEPHPGQTHRQGGRPRPAGTGYDQELELHHQIVALRYLGRMAPRDVIRPSYQG